MGLIEKVYADDLDLVRSAKIKLSTQTLVRDICKICLLEAVEELGIAACVVYFVMLIFCIARLRTATRLAF